MGKLFDNIRRAVDEQRYVVGAHAAERLDERGIAEWQVVTGLRDGALVRERPRDRPNPSVEVQQILADGTPVVAVWAWLAAVRESKLVTVFFPDEK